MRHICLIYKNYLYYFSLASTFIIILGISNFQHKALLFFSPWFLVFLNKSYIENLWRTTKDDQLLKIVSIAISLHILVSSYLNNSAVENHLIALVFISWLPIKAFTEVEIKHDAQRTYIKLYSILLLAKLLIFSTLVWHKFIIGIDRPLGIGHNVVSGPLICIFSITSFEIACRFHQVQKSNFVKKIYAGISIIFIFGSTITSSRTAFLCAIAGIVFVIIRYSPRINKRWLFASLITISGVFIFSGNRIQEVFTDIQNYKNGNLYTSLGGRLEAINWAVENIPENIFFGISTENVAANFNSRYKNQQLAAEYLPHLHNDFLQLGMAFGLPSAILFFLFIYTLYKKNYPASMRYIIFCLMTVSMFDSLIYNTEALVAFFGIIGINLALHQRKAASNV